MLLKIDRNILSPDSKRHPYFFSTNSLHDNFVDFTKMPKDLTKDQK